jgi:two-component system nitrogen regulation response regulator GlnG
MSKVLVVDDSPSTVRVLHTALENTGIEVLSAGCAAEALEMIASHQPDVVILDIVLPDQSWLASFAQIQKLDPTIPVILITAAGTSDTAITAMRLGALDYLLKPLDIEKVRDVVAQGLRIRRFTHVPVRVNETDASDATEADLLIGRCPAMQEVYKAIGRVAQKNVHALIRGESGTGKELVARAIYQHGPRSAKPFLAVNCAAIPETLLESELFGHEKGSFTGAATRRIGKFEQCHGGTLFLDEVGDMTPLMQSKVLRVLQDKRFERVGGNDTIESDVWIAAATNRDLEAMVASSQFRADLYYRLNGFPIILPPLRERGEDIPILVKHFLSRFARVLGKPVCEVSGETMDLLVRYSWPGNIRELQSALKQAMIQTTGPVLLPEFLPAALREADGATLAAAPGSGSPTSELDGFIAAQIQTGTQSLHADLIAYVERILLDRVLRYAEGNQSQAAQILGITRGSLRNKIREYGIRIRQSVSVADKPGEVEANLCGLRG